MALLGELPKKLRQLDRSTDERTVKANPGAHGPGIQSKVVVSDPGLGSMSLSE